jgi:RNA polymerase sigma factor (sigma-70 family)
VDVEERAELSAQMARLADGDREAFAFVFGRLWPALRRFSIRALADDAAEADDAAQKALLSIMTRASDYDARRDALAWAIGIAAWECRSARRRRERRRESSVPPQLVASAPSPEDAVIEQDLRRAMEEALGHLDDVDLAALGWIETTDASSPATVRKRRQRALVRLRAVWSRLHAR